VENLLPKKESTHPFEGTLCKGGREEEHKVRKKQANDSPKPDSFVPEGELGQKSVVGGQIGKRKMCYETGFPKGDVLVG